MRNRWDLINREIGRISYLILSELAVEFTVREIIDQEEAMWDRYWKVGWSYD